MSAAESSLPPVLARQRIRELDRRAIEEFGVPGVVLMENAGRGVADLLCRWADPTRVAICCGRGNNAGDGFVLARHLDLRGFDARVLLWSQPSDLAGDAAVNFRIVRESGIPLSVFGTDAPTADVAAVLATAEWIVDALLGTGARGAPRPPLDAVIRAVNSAEKPVLAVDLPSGLDCDSGEPADPTVRARATATFVAHKPGFLVPEAAAFTGGVHVVDIGAPRRLVEEMLSGDGE